MLSRRWLSDQFLYRRVAGAVSGLLSMVLIIIQRALALIPVIIPSENYLTFIFMLILQRVCMSVLYNHGLLYTYTVRSMDVAHCPSNNTDEAGAYSLFWKRFREVYGSCIKTVSGFTTA